jgi:hypothetical protein
MEGKKFEICNLKYVTDAKRCVIDARRSAIVEKDFEKI